MIMTSFYTYIKKLFPNSLKHIIKQWLGLVQPQNTLQKIPSELLDVYDKMEPHTPHNFVQESFVVPVINDLLITKSSLTKQDFFETSFFKYWYTQLNYINTEHKPDEVFYHRKIWEHIYIIQALYERNNLTNNKCGLGFAVGLEPLPALFAKLGCQIIATDLRTDEADKLGWVQSEQHSNNDLSALNRNNICPPDQFNKQVSFRNVDMNIIPDDLTNFDFCWSSCAFEHLGSIEKGLKFVTNAMKTLKPGGIAIHTTEYNLSSDTQTIDNNPSFVIFRKQDILRLVQELTGMWSFCFTT
jgi:SAM-dependent methyltransferase